MVAASTVALCHVPGAALLEAHNSGMSVIIKEGMANGRLFPSEDTKPRKLFSGLTAVAEKVRDLAGGISLAGFVVVTGRNHIVTFFAHL